MELAAVCRTSIPLHPTAKPAENRHRSLPIYSSQSVSKHRRLLPVFPAHHVSSPPAHLSLSASMVTHHLTIVYYKDQYHIAQYGQSDGQPSGHGIVVLRFVSHPVNVAKLKAVLDNAATMLYTPTDAQLDACTAHFGRALITPAELDEWNSAGFHPEAKKVCPSVCACTGAGILDVVANAVPTEPVPIVKTMEFLADGLFCEFAYVVDLDAEALEVYSGRWGRPMERQGESRFRSVECLKEERYLPPLIGRCVFSDLPDEDGFVEALR